MLNSVDYVQYLADPVTGFAEYRHGIEYLAQLYPRWVSMFTLRDRYRTDQAVSAGPDGVRAHEAGDAGDGYDILVVKLTDHRVPDKGKQTLLFSLSIHGDEKGGIEGGVRVAEDLAMAAEHGGRISDGIPGYDSATGKDEVEFHQYEVADVLRKEVVYLVDFNVDGWAAGDHFTEMPGPLYTRGNYTGTDLNRQMPTVGRIDPDRNPLEEREMFYGHKLMHEVAKAGRGGLMAYGADVHGESQSRAWVDIMYPAGQFDSVKHRQHMSIAERTKSNIDDTLFLGLVDFLEENTGGDLGEGLEDVLPVPENVIPSKPARWGTVWDTLGYTDTGFLGDYLASELGVTGMDYEIALNHADIRAHSRPWAYLLQENFVNATRAIVKTAMAYALYQEREFASFQIRPGGKVGYVHNPDVTSHNDENGPGMLPGPEENGVGEDGQKVVQRPYAATNMKFFTGEAKYVRGGLQRLLPADIAASPKFLDRVDSLVIADVLFPADAKGRRYSQARYLANLKAWVQRGGNLVLTDRGLHALGGMGVVPATAVTDVRVYQPYANFGDLSHPMTRGLRGNARQLVEATLVGYGIGNDESPMTVVATDAWTGAGGTVVGTTGDGAGSSDGGARTSVGELALGKGKIRIIGGALPMPNDAVSDHRYGLKDYALTYSGLYLLENSIVHDAPNLGRAPAKKPKPRPAVLDFLTLTIAIAGISARRRARRTFS